MAPFLLLVIAALVARDVARSVRDRRAWEAVLEFEAHADGALDVFDDEVVESAVMWRGGGAVHNGRDGLRLVREP